MQRILPNHFLETLFSTLRHAKNIALLGWDSHFLETFFSRVHQAKNISSIFFVFFSWWVVLATGFSKILYHGQVICYLFFLVGRPRPQESVGPLAHRQTKSSRRSWAGQWWCRESNDGYILVVPLTRENNSLSPLCWLWENQHVYQNHIVVIMKSTWLPTSEIERALARDNRVPVQHCGECRWSVQGEAGGNICICICISICTRRSKCRELIERKWAMSILID